MKNIFPITALIVSLVGAWMIFITSFSQSKIKSEYNIKYESLGVGTNIIEVQRGNKKYILYSGPGGGVCKLDEEKIEGEWNPTWAKNQSEGLLND